MPILIDSNAVIEYVAKYYNKVRTASEGFANILSGVLRHGTAVPNLETTTLLRKSFCHAMPCYAMPWFALPCHTMPCHALPYLYFDQLILLHRDAHSPT